MVSSPGIETGEHSSTNIKCRKLAKLLIDKGISVEITWICAHAGLAPNELADMEAKKPAKMAERSDSLTTALVATANSAIKKHQLEWNSDSTDRTLYNIRVGLRWHYHQSTWAIETKLN